MSRPLVIRPVHVVTVCLCTHQKPEHHDARYNPDDPVHRPGPCKQCRCREFRDANPIQIGGQL